MKEQVSCTKQEQRPSSFGLCLARRRKTKSIEEQKSVTTPVGEADRNFSIKVWAEDARILCHAVEKSTKLIGKGIIHRL